MKVVGGEKVDKGRLWGRGVMGIRGGKVCSFERHTRKRVAKLNAKGGGRGGVVVGCGPGLWE